MTSSQKPTYSNYRGFAVVANACVQGLVRHVVQLGESLQCHSTMFHRVHVNVRALVTRLLLRGGPAAVVRRVVPVDVDPIDRGSSWCSAHIQQECVKVVAPPVTYRNAASAIDRILRVGWAIASGLHFAPRPILLRSRRSPLSGGLAVLQAACGCDRSTYTPARVRSAARKGVRSSDDCLSALADAIPARASILALGAVLHGQSSVLSAGKINQSHV